MKRHSSVPWCLRMVPTTAMAVVVGLLASGTAEAQENYEIQVYGSETMAPRSVMYELHSNFTFHGRREFDGLQRPTNKALHETVEITAGLNAWSELGFYLFTSERSGDGLQIVGTHIRPRVRAPENWNLPVGLSLSVEAGYQRAQYDAATWSVEIRPIIDHHFGAWYASFNPVVERALVSDASRKTFDFSPNLAINADVSPKVNLGVEYYGGVGEVGHFLPASEQQHQLFGVINLELSPLWEFNLGYGTTLTNVGDRQILKLILGRRVQYGH